MQATIHIPYSYGDPVNGFKYDDPTFTDRRYIQLITEDYNRYKNDVDAVMYQNYDTYNDRFRGSLVMSNRRKIKREYVKQGYQYHSCKCVLRAMDGSDETIDNLIDYYKSGEQFITLVKLFNLASNPDMETDVKMWLRDSNHINTSPRLTEEEKIFNLPRKDFKVTFNAKSTAVFKECKVAEIFSASEFAVLVNKVTFVVDDKS